jgi:SAM-dependent methyltransferase
MPDSSQPPSGGDPSPTRLVGVERALDYEATRAFFDGRAARAEHQPALTAVLYQDDNPKLARQRDEVERDMVLGWLRANRSFRALDIGCGIGRWGSHLAPIASAYQGIDFSEGLVDLARRSLAGSYLDGAFAVDVLSAPELAADRLTLDPPFDLIVEAGLLVYLNDADAEAVLRAIPPLLSEHAVVYLREPVATGERLTLDRHWSDELQQQYSATYRPVGFYRDLIDRTLVGEGFTVTRSVALDPSLANRSDTNQHFFLLER